MAFDKKKAVDGLISNTATKWEEKDRAFLDGLNEEQLTKLEPVTNTPAPAPAPAPAPTKTDVQVAAEEGASQVAPTNNGTPAAPQTLDQYIANAPPEMRDVLRSSVSVHNSEKNRLIDTIVASPKNKFTKEFLANKALEELQGLAALVEEPKPTNNGTPPMYYGATGAPVLNTGGAPEEPLVRPTLNFEKQKA